MVSLAVVAVIARALGLPWELANLALYAVPGAYGTQFERNCVKRDLKLIQINSRRLGWFTSVRSGSLQNWAHMNQINTKFTERIEAEKLGMSGSRAAWRAPLRGKVLAIGGLKEKLLAALRAGIFETILPRANEKDLSELPDNIKNAMKLRFVDTMDEVLAIALERPLPTPLPAETENLAAVPPTEVSTNLPAPQ